MYSGRWLHDLNYNDWSGSAPAHPVIAQNRPEIAALRGGRSACCGRKRI